MKQFVWIRQGKDFTLNAYHQENGIALGKKDTSNVHRSVLLKFCATLDWDPHQSLDKIKPHPDEAARQQIQFSPRLTKLVFPRFVRQASERDDEQVFRDGQIQIRPILFQ